MTAFLKGNNNMNNNEVLTEIIRLRHEFHRHPELSNQEFKTTEKIAEILTNWGDSNRIYGFKYRIIGRN